MNNLSAAALIRSKREAARLGAEQLRAPTLAIADDSWSEDQCGALAMAVAWRGMSVAECRDLIVAQRDSGQRPRWDHVPGPVPDKHATGPALRSRHRPVKRTALPISTRVWPSIWACRR